MSLYVITRQHINALRAMLAGVPTRRRKEIEKQIRKLEQETKYNENNNDSSAAF